MKIYTKTGDCGTTGLFAGPRVDKDHPRIEAYGAVDELSATLGVVVATLRPVSRSETQPKDELSATLTPVSRSETQPKKPNLTQLAECLQDIQSDLFAIGAELATPDPVKHGMCLLRDGRVEELEQWIDRLEAHLPPLESFILPGGGVESATLQLARTVCRRAERQVVQLSHDAQVYDCSRIVVYLNRLSDLLFVFARFANFSLGIVETQWHPQR